MKQRRILVAGLNGWAVRNTLYSGLLGELARQGQVILAPTVESAPDESALARFAPGVELAPVERGPGMPALPKAAHRCWRLLNWRHDFRVRFNNETYQTQHHYGYCGGRPSGVRSLAARGLAELAHGFGLRRWLIKQVDRAISEHPASRAWSELIRRRQVDTLYLPSSLFQEDIVVAAVARHHGIRVVGGVLSWDNLAKERVPGDFARYLVWGDVMRRQLLAWYPHIAEHEVALTGALQFDWYHQDRWSLSREEFCRAKGLDPDRPYLLYACTTPRLAPGERIIVAALADACLRPPLNRWKPQLYVRLHPKENGARFARLGTLPDHVVMDEPNAGGSIWRWSPRGEDVRDLVNTLRHAAAVVNIFSTITLDGMILDRPVINVSWSPGAENGKPWIGALGGEFTHFRPVIAAGATPVAKNLDELIAAIARYLERPALHREERAQVCQSICGPLDGKAHQRVCREIIDAPA